MNAGQVTTLIICAVILIFSVMTFSYLLNNDQRITDLETKHEAELDQCRNKLAIANDTASAYRGKVIELLEAQQ